MPLLSSGMGDRLAVDVNEEDDWDLRAILPFDAIDVQSSLRGDSSAVQERCLLYLSDGSANAGDVFQTELRGLYIICELDETLERVATSQLYAQELESEKSRLHEASMEAQSLRKVVARLQRELSDAYAQSEDDFPVGQTRADADGDMLHAAVWDCTHVKMLLDAERQKRQISGCVLTDMQRFVGRHSKMVDPRGRLFLLTCPIRIRRVCDRSCLKFLDSFAIVLPYSNLTLIGHLEQVSLLFNKVCTQYR